MRKFLRKTLLFLVPLLLLILLGLVLPTTPRAAQSLLMSSVLKDSLLGNTPSPRILFVGGSNLSFGLNSQRIQDSLLYAVINTGISANIGIKYMIDNTLASIKENDIVVLIPEYHQYYRNLDEGSPDLLRVILDGNRRKVKHLNRHQIFNLLAYLPKYSLKKFVPLEYIKAKNTDIYSLNSFNSFGDIDVHWSMKGQDVTPFAAIEEDFNPKVIDYMEAFAKEAAKKEAIVLVSFPCYQESSFNNSRDQIQKVEEALRNSALHIIGSAQRYMVENSLIFNTPYHPIRKGLENRTDSLIEDISVSFCSAHASRM